MFSLGAGIPGMHFCSSLVSFLVFVLGEVLSLCFWFVLVLNAFWYLLVSVWCLFGICL